jgi:hypothetical protein
MIAVAGGILLALAILGVLRRLPEILLVLFVLYLIGSCVGPNYVRAAPFDKSSGERPFDWDRYNARQDACTEADRIAMACTRGYCDELALRQAKRACSAPSL